MGRVDVDAMLDEMTPEELTEWLAYWSLEPFGPIEEWTRSAMVCATTYNASGNAKRPAKVEDFMPEYKWQEDDDSKAAARDADAQQAMLASRFGAKK